MIWAVLLIFGSLTSRADSMEPMKTTVCAISAHPARFAGKKVVLSAELNSDGIERVTLTDKNCEDVGIAIETSDHFIDEATFDAALSSGHPGTLDKTISGTFVGIFH
jgi:hypothetical protein